MALRECPLCGASVKLENMKRHFANVHPGQDPARAISEEEQQAVRRTARAPRSSRSSRRVVWWTLVAVAVVAVGVVGVPYLLQQGASFNVVAYCGSEGTSAHYHALLVINMNGVQKEVPSDVGITNQAGLTNPTDDCSTGLHVLHTHDGSGIIHAELPAVPPTPPTLGNFFTIWGEPLSSNQVWSFSGTVTATVFDMDTRKATDYSADPGAIPLYVPEAGAFGNAYTIPPSLIFNGAYGNGQSNGVFSGEVIWLNVTA